MFLFSVYALLLSASAAASNDDGRIVPSSSGFGSLEASEADTGAFARNDVAIPTSPECWVTAMGFFSETQDLDDDSAATFCRIMPEDKQKLLALLIAQCHLQDLGRPLIDDAEVLAECIQQYTGRVTRRDSLQFCLKHLSDVGANAYTHYVSYVQQLCTRLTQELVLLAQREAHKQAANKFSHLSIQSIEQLESISALARRHSEHMEALAKVPVELKEQLTGELGSALKDLVSRALEERLQMILRDELEGRLGDLLKQQAKQQKSFVESVRDHFQSINFDQREYYESWMNNQTLTMQGYLKEIERQHNRFGGVLSQTISQAVQVTQPFLGLIAAVMKGYTWVAFALQFIMTFNIVWLLTRYIRYDAIRFYLLGIVVVEAAAEAAITSLTQHDFLNESDRVQVTIDLRRWGLFLEGFLFVSGAFVSFISPSRRFEMPEEENPFAAQVQQQQAREEMTTAQAFETSLVEVSPSAQQHRVAIIPPPRSSLAYHPYTGTSVPSFVTSNDRWYEDPTGSVVEEEIDEVPHYQPWWESTDYDSTSVRTLRDPPYRALPRERAFPPPQIVVHTPQVARREWCMASIPTQVKDATERFHDALENPPTTSSPLTLPPSLIRKRPNEVPPRGESDPKKPKARVNLEVTRRHWPGAERSIV